MTTAVIATGSMFNRMRAALGPKVARVDLEQSRIDFTLAEAPGASRPAVSQPLARGDRAPKSRSRR